MPVQFLTDADHQRLNSFPDEITHEELHSFFLLSPDELDTVMGLRGDHNRLGFALQLCCLRYLGFFPEDLSTIPAPVVEYVASQLLLDSEILPLYGKRIRTRQDHQRQVQILLGYRRASPLDVLNLERWLVERALEHDKPTLLFEMACSTLKRQKILRLGTTRLAQIVSAARQQAQEVTYQKLQCLLTEKCCTFLDSLLEVDASLGTTRLWWLQQAPTDNNLGQMLTTLAKIAFLQDHGIAQWELSGLSPNRVKLLAKFGAKATNQYLQRANEVRRYPILVAFLSQALYTFTDALIEMFDQRLWDLYSKAKRQFETDRLKATKSINAKLRTLRDIGRVLLDPSVDDKTVRTVTFEQISPEQLQVALEETEQLLRPENDAYVDYFGKYYNCIRRFSGKLLSTLDFHAHGNDQGLIKALNLVRALHAGNRRKLPADAPTQFIPDAWRRYVLEEIGGMNRRYYELAALWILRQQMRSGDIYVTHSRRFRELERYFMPEEEWLQQRDDVLGLLGTPKEAEARLEERERELIDLLGRVESQLNREGADLRSEQEKLVLSPLEAEDVLPEMATLKQTITACLPRLDITDLLIEVDTWTGFSDAFEHLHGSHLRDGELQLYLYASLLAQACNLGVRQMANAADLAYRRLSWCNIWYIRDDTLREAMTKLINYHYHLPFSHLWGGGMLSSSDGQRFPVRGKLRKARALPRYFGYGKGITFYSWTSDQFSQYGSKAIPTTVRDATYVLDEILNNETELAIIEHTTDTAGYTEVIFALFDLLGLRFSPRLRDLADQQLYRTSQLKMDAYPQLKEHLSGVINKKRILPYWDEMLRLVGSLKLGWVTASLIVQKLQAFPRKHPLTRALQEYGRLIKTLHILRWYDDESNRRRLNRQLNKGEALHMLRSHLRYGDHGEVRGKQDEQLQQQVGCLNLVTNAVILWNTVYIEKVVQQLRNEGHSIDDEDLKQIWPTRYAHINVYGRYHFNEEDIGKKRELRPLRKLASNP